MATTSSVSIASNALLLLGHESIASFTENTTGAIIAASLYEGSYLSLLTTHRWRFATKKAQLARLSAAPLNSYQYQFQIPADCIYVIQTTTKNYEIYESTIYCNDSEMSIDYMYRVNEDMLPPYFVTMLEFYLASKFSVPVTGDLNKADMYSKAYLNELKRAKFADSTQRPSTGIKSSPYIDVRN